MEEHLGYLNLSLEVDGRWEMGADGLFQILSGLEEVVAGGGGYSNGLYVVSGVQSHIRNLCLGERGSPCGRWPCIRRRAW